MKHLLSLSAAATLMTVFATFASADTRAPAGAKFVLTRITGTITVPAAPAGALAGFDCSSIIVGATSVAFAPLPPGGLFAQPKWARGVTATGNYASGTCSYTINVPGNSAFVLATNGYGDFECDYVQALLGTTGQLGPITVAPRTTKTQNFAISRLACEFIQ